MRFLFILLLSGCSVAIDSPLFRKNQNNEELVKAVNQHALVLDAISTYIQQLQSKKIIPSPDELQKETK